MADFLSEPISKLSDAVIFVATTTADFKPQLEQLSITLQRITSKVDEITKLNRELDRPEQDSTMFTSIIKKAEDLVNKCLKIKWNYFKKFTHSLKLKDVNNKLLRVFQLEAQADQCRDGKETLLEVKAVKLRMDSLVSNLEDLRQKCSLSRREQVIERKKLGWRVPKLPKDIVGFDEPLARLKAKVIADNDDDSVVVVSAAGGCGKTTLAKMLCNDPQIQEKFGENLFFVTVSATPNFMVIVNDLLNPNSLGQQVGFQSSEDAKNKLENFLGERVPSPILVVLDDVWSESFINNFVFDIGRYKIVVTSRMVITKYHVFKFDPLSDEDAKTLFCHSAFTEYKRKPTPSIDEHLVDQMVTCCKKHPLTLFVVGGSLNGKDESIWRQMLKELSRGHSVLDLNEEILKRLETSFDALDNKFKECFLDFGLFVEDQRIPASVLLNIWVHFLRKDPGSIVNYCEQQYVTQHDLLRQLAINLSGKLPIAHRIRLIINAQGEDLPDSISQMQEPMEARILSISTGESFASRWCNIKVPEVEVLVLNLMSKMYALPHFLKEMQKLKILNVTNYGLYPTEFKNFHLLGCLSNLMRIRLERVAISSLSGSTLGLINLQKVSFIMCKIGNAFEELSSNTWPGLVEIEMDYCQDLVGFPSILCSSVHLKRMSITNCNEMCELPEEIGNLTSLETLSLCSCTKLEKLPESVTRLEKLSIVDISDCLSLTELPEEIGKLGGLRKINMKGCTGVHEIPTSAKELSNTQVICNEEISYQWQDFCNVEVIVVEEDRLESLMRII
ncbi:Disease resistance protein [Cynara cardunculus var. scolymus]|uniref:Disease resistance protein n=1 Tax=Cynara cardunculus var. scolymus TaxID=59895 RepID=A0A103Y393_CYNCS|nr:Disease resistance protein [Cynara cardunculus var. scolymus]